MQQELAREPSVFEKDHQHYTNIIGTLIEQGKIDAAKSTVERSQIAKAIEDVDYRVANVRAGYVYVISNVGAFGDHMVKIGLTHRLVDPTKEQIWRARRRIRPVSLQHRMRSSSDDAVRLEAKMHDHLAERQWITPEAGRNTVAVLYL